MQLLQSSVFFLIFGLVSLSTNIAGNPISDYDLVSDQLLTEDAQNDNDYDSASWFMDGEKEGSSDDVYEDLKEEETGNDESSEDAPAAAEIITVDTKTFVKDVPPAEKQEQQIDLHKCQEQTADDGTMVVICSARGLQAVPGNLDPVAVALDLGGNSISDLSASSFPDKMDNLKVLNFTKNHIKTIDKNAFVTLPRLEKLDLSSNALSALEPETFSGLSALRELDLGENPLQVPAASLFLLAPALTRLRLAGCGLTALPVTTFDGMASLKHLDLGDNPIAEDTPIELSVFAALTNLTTLTLPLGADLELVTEVCRSHGLLLTVCLGDCVLREMPCYLELKDKDKDEDRASDEVPEPPAVFAAAFPRLASAPVVPETPDSVAAEAPEVVEEPVAAEAPEVVEEPVAAEAPEAPAAEEPMEFPAVAAADPAPPAEPEAPANEDMSNEPAKKGESDDKSSSDESDSIPESSRSGVNAGGVNKTIIGLVIGGILAAVAAVIVKKNWSKIRGKRDDDRRPGVAAQRRVAEVPEHSPEETPLQSKTPA